MGTELTTVDETCESGEEVTENELGIELADTPLAGIGLSKWEGSDGASGVRLWD